LPLRLGLPAGSSSLGAGLVVLFHVSGPRFPKIKWALFFFDSFGTLPCSSVLEVIFPAVDWSIRAVPFVPMPDCLFTGSSWPSAALPLSEYRLRVEGSNGSRKNGSIPSICFWTDSPTAFLHFSFVLGRPLSDPLFFFDGL